MLTIIYSNKNIPGKKGVYANPDLFDKPRLDADTVYTDDKNISSAYKEAGVKVLPLTTKKKDK